MFGSGHHADRVTSPPGVRGGCRCPPPYGACRTGRASASRLPIVDWGRGARGHPPIRFPEEKYGTSWLGVRLRWGRKVWAECGVAIDDIVDCQLSIVDCQLWLLNAEWRLMTLSIVNCRLSIVPAECGMAIDDIVNCQLSIVNCWRRRLLNCNESLDCWRHLRQ